MNYKLHRKFDDANQNLIFHTRAPAERWCFARAHLVHAAALPGRIKFRFPLFQVEVKVADSEEVLERVLGGFESMFSEVAADPSASSVIATESIIIESVELLPY